MYIAAYMDLAHQYFNAGVLLMNPKKLLSDNFLDKISEIANKYAQHISLGDQDLLNKYADNAYLQLPWRFNMTTRFIEMGLAHSESNYRQQMNSEYNYCVIRHFESPRKPWNSEINCVNNLPIRNATEFWAIADMTPHIQWFEQQFYISKMKKVQDKMIDKIEYHNIGHLTNLRLFGVIPVLKIRRHKSKKNYLLFDFIPLMSCKTKHNGHKKLWRLFDILTVFTTKM